MIKTTATTHRSFCATDLHDATADTEPCLSPLIDSASGATAFLADRTDQAPVLALLIPTKHNGFELDDAERFLEAALAAVRAARACEKWPAPAASAPCPSCRRTYCGGACNGGGR